MESLSKGLIDIHGLHVAEMVESLNEILPYMRKRNIRSLNIVTGSGHHTVGPQQGIARLLPAVESYCSELGLRFAYIRDPNGYRSGINVKL